jgi:hypothetical protein
MSSMGPWHGQFELSEGSAGRWRIGPLSLWIQRLKGEWRIARETAEDPLDGGLELEIPAHVDDLLTRETVDRFGMSADSRALEVAPATADRSVVARPEKPFYLPGGERVTVFVGSPLWVKISVGSPPVLLLDQPIFRPSDTWFGPTTMEGELCYASRTYLFLNLKSVPRRPHRALTVVTILNRSDTQLNIESLNLPVSRRYLYRGSDGQLWTQDVIFERDRDGDFAALRSKKLPPSRVKDASLVAGPRHDGEENVVMRAFSEIFS